jgi:RNA polymerase sigma-32 factor
MRDARLVRLGTSQTQRKLFFKLRKETARLEALGLDTSAEALAARLEVPVQEVIEMRDRLSRRDVSLDEPLHDDGDGTAVDVLPANDVGSDDQLALVARDGLVQASVRAFGETLTGRDRIVFERRMLADEPMTLRELGETLSISRERARQIEKAIAKKLERALRAVVPSEMLAA